MARNISQPTTSSTKAWRSEEDEVCPVCKSSRYLNPNMRFLVNPECYHRMCESCVDRIFSHGPAPCPVAGCHRTLRKQRFRKQTFEDIKVEREVDVRRRIAKIFNRREDDFTSLRAYNDYLEEVETLTFNLLHSINVSETELKLSQYASQNASSIAHNVLLSTQETASQEASSAADKERARLRRDAVRREAEEEKSELEEGRREIINQLANDQSLGNVNAEKIAREGQKVLLKRSSARRYALQGSGPHGRIGGGDVPVMIPSNGSIQEVTAGSGGDTGGEGGGLFFKGLKPRDEIEQQKNGRGGLQKMRQEKYDPFGGLGPGRRNGPGQNGSGPGGNGEEKRKEYEYFTLQHHYLHPWLEQAEKDPVIQAGGYNLKEYYQRALVEAFAGLGVMVGDEMGRKEDVNIGGGGGSGVGGSGGEGTPSTVEVAVKAAGNAALTRVGKEDGVL